VIVVTGARGSIGTALMGNLRDSGEETVIGFDIEDWDIRRPYRNPMLDQNVTMQDFDPRLVYHLAASKDAPEGEKDPKQELETNATGTLEVLKRWPRAQVVLASTCKACDPETAYGASKLIAERLVLNAGGSVARFHNVIETRKNVFEQWRALPEDASLPVAPCHRHFIHLADAVRLLRCVPLLPPGRYLLQPGPLRWMPDVAREAYPGRKWHYIEPRRGDRIREPMVATHERISPTVFDGILRVESRHDA
jgi:FlaA1/EpsC-like NDP-sugar epimerase